MEAAPQSAGPSVARVPEPARPRLLEGHWSGPFWETATSIIPVELLEGSLRPALPTTAERLTLQPSGTLLITEDRDDSGHVWDLRTGRLAPFGNLGTISAGKTPGWSPAGRYLVVQDYDARSAIIWEVASGRSFRIPARPFPKGTFFGTQGIVWSEDDRMVLRVGMGTAEAWDPATGKQLPAIPYRLDAVGWFNTNEVMFSADHGLTSSAVRWDLRKGKPVWVLPGWHFKEVSRDGRFALVANDPWLAVISTEKPTFGVRWKPLGSGGWNVVVREGPKAGFVYRSDSDDFVIWREEAPGTVEDLGPVYREPEVCSAGTADVLWVGKKWMRWSGSQGAIEMPRAPGLGGCEVSPAGTALIAAGQGKSWEVIRASDRVTLFRSEEHLWWLETKRDIVGWNASNRWTCFHDLETTEELCMTMVLKDDKPALFTVTKSGYRNVCQDLEEPDAASLPPGLGKASHCAPDLVPRFFRGEELRGK